MPTIAVRFRPPSPVSWTTRFHLCSLHCLCFHSIDLATRLIIRNVNKIKSLSGQSPELTSYFIKSKSQRLWSPYALWLFLLLLWPLVMSLFPPPLYRLWPKHSESCPFPDTFPSTSNPPYFVLFLFQSTYRLLTHYIMYSFITFIVFCLLLLECKGRDLPLYCLLIYPMFLK